MHDSSNYSDGIDIISRKTKIPLGWVATGSIVLSGMVLFFADIRTKTLLNESELKSMDKRVSTLENDLKREIQALRAELREYLQKHDRGQ